VGLEELKEKLQGVSVVMITPFKENLELDEEGLRKNARFLIEKGVREGTGFLVPAGSTGECFNLTNEERKRVFKIVVEEAKGEVPVVAGCNHVNTQGVIELARYAEDVGAEGVMIMPPYYGCASDDMMVKFYREIADEINIGIMVYNNSEVSGVDIPIEAMLRIAEIENVVAYKDCTENFIKYDLTTIALGDKINVLDGSGDFCEPYGMMIGRKGFITGFANFIPEIFLDTYKAVREGNYEKAKDLHIKLYPLYNFCVTRSYDHQGPFISMIKEATNIRKLPAGPVRPPLLPVRDEDKTKLEEIISNLIQT
jgi:4-hydroxy-tetrahydrodipicolinate synthase